MTFVTLKICQYAEKENPNWNDVYMPSYAFPCMHGMLRMVHNLPYRRITGLLFALGAQSREEDVTLKQVGKINTIYSIMS